MKSNAKVSDTVSVSARTRKECDFPSTKSTYTFYTAESDSEDEKEETVENIAACAAVGEALEDTISTIRAEIIDLDTIGFDETLLLDETVGM